MARKSKFSEAQIIAAIKECEAGATAKDVARRLGVSYETLNRWKATDLKRRQIRWLAGLARMFADIGRDYLDYEEKEDPTLEVDDLRDVDFTGPNPLENARY